MLNILKITPKQAKNPTINIFKNKDFKNKELR